MRRQLAVAGGLLLVAICAAQAEIVRLQVGQRNFGQGYMFVDGDGRCKVVTAAHVVTVNNTPAKALVLDRRARTLETEAPEIYSTSADLALLPVKIAADQCATSRISRVGLERRAFNLNDAVIETTGFSELRRHSVERVLTSMDSGGGEVFVVRPKDRNVQITAGWSGSIVLDQSGPVGIVYEYDAESGGAKVLRLDALDRLKPQRPAQTRRSAAAFHRIIVEKGETVDSANGASSILNVTGEWKVRPSQGQIVLIVEADTAKPVSEVIVMQAGTSAPVLKGLSIEVRLNDRAKGTFEPVRSCTVPSASAIVSCRIAEQERSGLRLIIETSAPELALGNIAIR